MRGFGVDCELAHLDSADYQFTGNGPDGLVLIGAERKSVNSSDLLQSIRLRRLAGEQIGKMLKTYDISYLIVEGSWRRGHGTGMLEVWTTGGWRQPRGNFKYAEVDNFLTDIGETAKGLNGENVRLWRTFDEYETCAAVADRYLWWQKDWDSHKLGKTIYAPEPTRLAKRGHKPSMFLHQPTLLEKWMCQLPGIDSKALTFSKHFSSAGDMATADADRWQKIKGVGKKTATAVVGAIWAGGKR